MIVQVNEAISLFSGLIFLIFQVLPSPLILNHVLLIEIVNNCELQ